ncbi:MAG: N-formylglutamate amidohydrolase [Crocinitomicaceae bacterium]
MYNVDQKTLKQEVLKLTDWHTDDLFLFEDAFTVKSKFFSCFFVMLNDSLKTPKRLWRNMAWALYTKKSDEGLTIRNINPIIREAILKDYYWPHHEKLNQTVEQQLKKFGKATILDCHSFPNKPFKRDLNQNQDRPDFNIGTDVFHTPKKLITLSNNFFNEKGFSVGLDWPYSGTIVPLSQYKKNKNVQSIMLEVNRSLYLDKNTNSRSKQYRETKDIIQEYLKLLKENCNLL